MDDKLRKEEEAKEAVSYFYLCGIGLRRGLGLGL